MRHDCEHCATAYEIPDHRVSGRFLKVRCKACRGTMHVVGLRALDAAGDAGAVWWVALSDIPRGPYRDDEVLGLVAAGDVQARTRMWRSGMAGWERVCESEVLAWVYLHVIEAAASDPTVLAVTSSVFDRAALLSDGHGYFPDPTLRSGIFILDTDTQRQLEQLAARHGILGASAPTNPEPVAGLRDPGNVPPQPAAGWTGRRTWTHIAAPLAAAGVSLLAAAAGIIWFAVTTPV